MDIVEVKTDYEDLSCSLPIQCLPSLNADFDGDVLNENKLITVEFKREFSKVFSPHTGFAIDRNNGLFNGKFGLIKDERINLWAFCTV